ncbi:hypothetical protein PGC08_05800 [Brevibacterium sp. BDJS002]|uniref:hypothetical protein n=1 Tax=Brevibacterium sp. BDJS002 TaxID=3020906 RepID=UPI0023072684|nr:hypothetical protein [Brevibacterium sp. BDJS002]WCE41196.1 hypothetical protein PGC08_05800 [Brevibacterium sp. BDJS002]
MTTKDKQRARPVIGRTVATRSEMYWDWGAEPHIAVHGHGIGKTNLARGLARQWPGNAFVLGQTYEWDVDEHRVEPCLDRSLPVLAAMGDGATEPTLLVVDGLDRQAVKDASTEDVERLRELLQRLSVAKNVHLLIITRGEQIEWAEPLQVIADDRLGPFAGHLLLRPYDPVVIEIYTPFVAPPGWEDRRLPRRRI